jgi:hypothetical protein
MPRHSGSRFHDTLVSGAGESEAEVIAAAEKIRVEELRDLESVLGKQRCDCDPSVGLSPCMDCVLRQSLLRLRRIFEVVERMREARGD